MKKRSLKTKALHSAWAVARAHGLAPKSGSPLELQSPMYQNNAMRRAMVRCYEAGYRAGRRDEAGGNMYVREVQP